MSRGHRAPNVCTQPWGSTLAVVICIDQGPRRFNYRVVGVAIHDGAVLLHRANQETFWTLPGGRAEHGESAEETISREMVEELGTSVDVVRLLWLVENFFDYDGWRYHELALYFLIRFPPDSRPMSAETFEAADGRTRLSFRWFPLVRERLAGLPLFPTFLADALTDLPTSVVHIVERAAPAAAPEQGGAWSAGTALEATSTPGMTRIPASRRRKD